LGGVAGEIGQRGEAGESIDQLLASNKIELPSIFRAVVQAGIRSGRLTVALEGMASTARRVAEVRRTAIQASIYPLIVLVLVGVLAVGVLLPMGETMQSMRLTHGLPDEGQLPSFIEVMMWLGQSMWIVAPTVVLAFVVWCVCTRRAGVLQPRRSSVWMSWLPWTTRLLRHGRLSTFAEVLALLIRHEVPLRDGLTLAAEASGDGALHNEAVEMSERLESGEPIDSTFRRDSAMPPLIRWQLLTQQSPERLAESLELISRSEKRRADQLAEWLRVQLPVILTIGIGGVATLIYAFAVLAPWYSMMTEIGDPLLLKP
jgi:general secretion pathway protein F